MRTHGAASSAVMLFFLAVLEPGLADVAEWTTNDGQLILQDVPEIPAELVTRLNQYQNMHFAAFLDWAEGDEGLYARTRFGDISQIHHLQFPVQPAGKSAGSRIRCARSSAGAEDMNWPSPWTGKAVSSTRFTYSIR